MKTKVVLVALVLLILLTAAEWYPIGDWTVLWRHPDAVNCGVYPDGSPVIKTTWQREIMEYGPIHGWYPTMQYKYTCNGAKPQETSEAEYLVQLPIVINIRTRICPDEGKCPP